MSVPGPPNVGRRQEFLPVSFELVQVVLEQFEFSELDLVFDPVPAAVPSLVVVMLAVLNLGSVGLFVSCLLYRIYPA